MQINYCSNTFTFSDEVHVALISIFAFAYCLFLILLDTQGTCYASGTLVHKTLSATKFTTKVSRNFCQMYI